MKTLQFLTLCTVIAVCGPTLAQNAPGAKPAGVAGAAPGATPAPAAGEKPKPLSSGDLRTFITLAENLQFELKMVQQTTAKFRDGDPKVMGAANAIQKEATDLWTPVANMATARGVDPKKFPIGMSKADEAALKRLPAGKADKRANVTFLEFFAKETKKNATSTETAAKSVAEPELKTMMEKTATAFKAHAEQLDGVCKELKNPKKDPK